MEEDWSPVIYTDRQRGGEMQPKSTMCSAGKGLQTVGENWSVEERPFMYERRQLRILQSLLIISGILRLMS